MCSKRSTATPKPPRWNVPDNPSPQPQSSSPIFRRLAWRRLALAFALILVLIVLIADLGLGGEAFAFIWSLPYADKIGHFTLFGVLSLLVSLGFPTRRVRLLWLFPILKSSLFLMVFIIIEEATQIPLANRNFSLLDLTADFAGVYLFGELGAFLRSLDNRRSLE